MNGRVKKILLLTLAVVSLVGVVPIQRALNHDRNVLGLTRREPLENAPPILAFTTVALGGFRGLIANALWIRAMDLQDEDKFFEMAQLADWITKLEPHYTQVWLVQGWNMAYNISVKFKETSPGEFPDRWRWVHGGIKLLRDDGLRYNPNDVMIFRELAWFFQHKMGANLDDANMYYKREWAKEMTRVLGDKPNLDELVNPQTDEARQRLQILTNEFKLDPAFMKQVNERYGPLEWRLPEAHAVYWAVKGLEAAKLNPTRVKQEDLIQLRRVVFQSMFASFRHGRLASRPLAQRLEFGPNLAIIPRVNQAYEEAIEQEVQARENIKGAHRNFIRLAVSFLYVENRVADAADWYRYLGEKYPNKTIIDGKPDSFPRNVTLGEYVLAQMVEDVSETDRDKVRAQIGGFVANAFLALIKGDQPLYEGYRRIARDLRGVFNEKVGPGAGEARLAIETVEVIEKEVLGRMLDSKDGLPPELRAILRTELQLGPEEATPATNVPPASLTTPVNTNTPASTNR